MNAWILCEGDAARGLGHLYRCLAFHEGLLARSLRPKWFIDGDALAERFAAEHGLSADIGPWQSPALPGLPPRADIAICDSYTADAATCAALAGRVDHALWIDDEARLDYPPGTVLNPSPPARQRAARPDPPGSRPAGRALLSGFAHQPLRAAFAPEADRRIPESPLEVLVMLGGTDPRGLTPLAASAVRTVFPEAGLTVVVARPELRAAWRETLEGLQANVLGPQRALDLRGLMCSADLAVTAGGQTIFEMARLGLPAVAIEVATNQRAQLEALAAEGALVVAGEHSDPALTVRLLDALHALAAPDVRGAMSTRASATIDGRGVSRVLDVLLRGAGGAP
jgi:spore coat polysaccharide biosynthesis predicted glycosyltransferase SpsG